MISRPAAGLVWLAAAPIVAAAALGRTGHAGTDGAEAGTAAAATRNARRGAVEVIGPDVADSIRELTPSFTVNALDFTAGERPITLRLMLSTRADFAAPLFTDTTVAGETATIHPARALPERQPIWWRASATTALGETVTSPLYGPVPVAGWVRLVSPNAPNGTVLETRRPRFTWSSLPANEPPGPFAYDVNVISVGAQRTVIALRNWPDTTFLATSDLESNTSYRWEVIARLPSGETAVASSPSTFVVTDFGSPLTTLLYQNFPNPFPTATTIGTCIWFDLHEVARVRLEIFDLRGHPIRRLLRGDEPLLPGRYGRGATSDPSACAPQFLWDGTADDGRIVPAGVYLVRLRTGSVESIRRILFRGR